jgi:hypothetical protein
MDISDSVSLDDLALAFHESLVTVLPIRSGADRTCFRNVTRWLKREVQAGRLASTAFKEVLVYAREARVPGVRNPNAVFLTTLKREFHYDPKGL